MITTLLGGLWTNTVKTAVRVGTLGTLSGTRKIRVGTLGTPPTFRRFHAVLPVENSGKEGTDFWRGVGTLGTLGGYFRYAQHPLSLTAIWQK